MAVIAEFQGEAAGVEMRAPLAVFVNQPAIGELGPVLHIQRRRLAEGQNVQDGREEVVGIGGAAGDIDHRFAGKDLMHRFRQGRIGVARRNAAPGRAGTDGDDRRRAFRRLLDNFEDRLAGDHAIDAAIFGRDRAVHHQHELAPVLLHGLGLVRLGLMAGSGAEGLVIVEGDQVENQGFERRMVGAQQRLGAAGAFLRR